MTIMSNWKSIPLGEVAPANSNRLPDGNTEVWNLSLEEVESITGRILKKSICRVRDLGSAKCSFDEKHVLYSKLRPYLNKVVLPDKPGVGTSELIPMLPDPDRLDREFLAYYLRSPVFLEFANANTRGANLPRIAMKELWKHKIPVPETLGEQHRIVARIKECIKRVEEIKALRQDALREAERFYPSRCHEIFTDQNTDEWNETKISKISDSIQYGYTQSASKENIGPHFLRITDIQDQVVNWASVPYCEADRSTFEKYRLVDGDILFARTGATTGKSFLITGDPPNSVFASYLICLKINRKKVIPRLVYHFFQSPSYWYQVYRNKRGGAQPNINSKVLGLMSLRFPSMLNKQEALVAQLDEVFEFAQRLKVELRNQSGQITYLRESILRKAFAGEL